MDGGDRQKEKADRLKLEIKRLAGARREKRHMQNLQTGMDGLEVGNVSVAILTAANPVVPTAGSSSTASVNNGTPQDSGSESCVAERGIPSLGSSTPPSSFEPAAAPTPSTLIGKQVPVHRVGLEDRDLGFMMLYLDYTFPFLYPFYRPSILEGGRGWLPVTMMRNKALFHIALSLSSYLMTEVLKNGSDAHNNCKQHNWDSLQAQQQLAMRELQADLQELNSRGVQGNLVASCQVVSSVMQLLTFEVAITDTGNWQMHLDAASLIFEQIMEHHGTGEAGNACWHRVLYQLGDGVVPNLAGEDHRPWSPDQASLRFFTASLLFFDTLSATALGRAPRLLKYHDHLLTVLDNCCGDHLTPPSVPHLKIDDFFGVPNPVVQAIAATAALQEWKTAQRATNSLSMAELVSRAGSIEHGLKSHIAELDKVGNPDAALAATTNPIVFSNTGLAQPPPLPLSACCSEQVSHPPCGHITARIWAQAALTYLRVVVSSWQPSSPEIRESVALTASLLRRLPAPAGLRSVVWPFAVTGCLVGAEEQQEFRDLVSALGPLQIFGTVREALAIMERVWAHRECIGLLPDGWDLSVGLSSLGHASLLI